MRRIRIVVADRCEARFFDTLERGTMLRSAGVLTDADGRKLEHELVSDRSGTIHAGGHSHNSLDPHESHRERETAAFAQQVAIRLAADFLKDRFDEIALVAAPRFLGALRKALPESLHARVNHEIHHDLVHQGEVALRAHLPEHWPQLPRR